MKLQIRIPKISLRLFLATAFVVVLLLNTYIGYKYLYPAYVGAPVEVPEESVVRVNSRAYQNTVDYLEQLYNYFPEPLSLPRTNPFQ